MILAAIDIGSNAARLLITEVTVNDKKAVFEKLNLVRVPLRLGFDVFDQKEISAGKAAMFLNCIRSFKYLMDAYGVVRCKAAATSAMRDARNSAEVLDTVRKETGIEIEVISGDDEASFIYENHIAENLDKENAYLYIDVGGGSTELTCFADNRLLFKKSFNIGTIRLIKNQVTEAHWDQMKDFLKKEIKGMVKHLTAIGSGGNINKVFSLSKRKDGKPLTLELLKDYYKELNSFSVAERMHLYNLKEDRADVIVPALQIYVNVMRWIDAQEIFVPKIGLADGLIQALYREISALNPSVPAV
ncbi:MAG: exopolyphosphatase [Bacteroidota bacterium]|nr:exopolyphosphatase [Bacteroidota bacterium]MDP4211532.1 exopolyphosphatase [Bacteroidota bacterium]MDP4249747.1 exopolyphosphatase [Bacteroidota bacterium]